ncbi:HEAT repeat domain-containing protein [uncultured Paludibaculum sp.]|uniref:HEAT repeat domain-containing protein n=1 Tax=uncultured Paludibaculum sp. TaxID=1765020 RepID=UPI002AAB2FCB|nr:HEAT repeat domain-containing protein [uncultured Paludibaculum sp.]
MKLPASSSVLVIATGLVVACSPLCGWQDKETDKLKIRALRDYARQGSETIPKITPYFQDINVEVRREAVKAVVQIGTQRSLEPLAEVCSNNDAEVQIRATDGLVNFYLPGYVDHGISATLRRAGDIVAGKWTDRNDEAIDPDTPIRPEISEALARLVSGGSSMDSRANAARALGILRDRASVPALTSALRSKDSRLMYESLVALQKIRDRSAGPSVVFLVRDLDEKVQLAAIETAGILGPREAIPQLKRVLENSGNKKVKRAAVVALGQIPDASNHSLFVGLLRDKDEEVRAGAAEGLGRLAIPEDRPVLEKAWEEEGKTSPRLSQAFALSMLGETDTGSLKPLGFLVNNLNQRAWRNVALPFLSELCLKPAHRQAIVGSIQASSTQDEKTGIAQALSRCKSADAIPALEKLTKDEDPAVSREALRGLRILRASIQ